MSTFLDTSVLVDLTRGHEPARAAVRDAAREGAIHSSEAVRAELLIGIREPELAAIGPLLQRIIWHPVDRAVSERAGALGRTWLRSHPGIDAIDFIVAATAELTATGLLTLNVRHFPMVAGLARPY